MLDLSNGDKVHKDRRNKSAITAYIWVRGPHSWWPKVEFLTNALFKLPKISLLLYFTRSISGMLTAYESCFIRKDWKVPLPQIYPVATQDDACFCTGKWIRTQYEVTPWSFYYWGIPVTAPGHAAPSPHMRTRTKSCLKRYLSNTNLPLTEQFAETENARPKINLDSCFVTLDITCTPNNKRFDIPDNK